MKNTIIKMLAVFIWVMGLTGAVDAKQEKFDVCHTTGKGKIVVINIAMPATTAHLNKGDFLPLTFYYDADGDSFGDRNNSIEACEIPEGFVEDNTDAFPDDETEWADTDNDGIGDNSDNCPVDASNDIDGDQICGDVDNCPTDYNPYQVDTDNDGIGNICANCPSDVDGDEICGDVDNCPADFNPDQVDTDNDGVGDVCDYSGDLPFGVQHNYPEASLIADGWVRCYYQPYSDYTTLNKIQAACGVLGSESAPKYLFFGACQPSTACSSIFIGAAAPAQDILKPDPASCPSGGCIGNYAHYENGAYWYHVPDWSIGFAPTPLVNLNTCDMETSGVNARMCWHMPGWVGGWSAGAYRWLNTNTSWRKVVYRRD